MSQIINSLKKAKAMILLSLQKMTEYKTRLVSFFILVPVKILIWVIIWSCLYSGKSLTTVYSYNNMIMYYVVLSVYDVISMPFCTITYELMEDIRSGNLDMYIVKPLNYFYYRYFEKSNNILLLLIGLVILSIFNQRLFSINFIANIFLFIVSTIIIFLLFAIIGVMSFIVENVLTFRDNLWNIVKICSGSILPLSMYPAAIQKIFSYTPFPYIYYLPISTCLIIPNNLSKICLIAALWVVILMIVLNISWKLAIKHYSSQGG